jgi:hypothetical protein
MRPSSLHPTPDSNGEDEVTNLPLAICDLFCTSGVAQQNGPVSGIWLAKFSAPNGAPREAIVVIRDNSGSWFQDRQNATPCSGQELPISVNTVTSEGFELAREGSRLEGVCNNVVLPFKRVDEKTFDGSLPDGRIIRLVFFGAGAIAGGEAPKTVRELRLSGGTQLSAVEARRLLAGAVQIRTPGAKTATVEHTPAGVLRVHLDSQFQQTSHTRGEWLVKDDYHTFHAKQIKVVLSDCGAVDLSG